MLSSRVTKTLQLAAAVGVLLFAMVLRLPYCTNDLLITDDADYIRSVANGLPSVYLERNSDSFFSFAKLVRGGSTAVEHPWNYLYQQGDAAALRHFHVPFGFYADAVLVHQHEPILANRLLAAVIGSTLCVMIFFYLCHFGVPLLLALGGAVLLAADSRLIATSTDVNPHTWFLLVGMLFLFTLVDFFQGPRNSAFLASLVLLACSFATLEYGPALLLTALLALALTWRTSNVKAFLASNWRRNAFIASAVFVGALFLLWPAGFFKGGYVKSYGVFVWQAAFQRGQLFGPLTPKAFWVNLFGGNWALVLLAVWAILGGCWLGLKRSCTPVLVLFIYSVLALGMNLGNRYRNPTYAAEVIVPLLVTVVLVSSAALQRITRPGMRIVFFASLGILCVFGLSRDLRYPPPRPRVRPLYIALESAVQSVSGLVPAHATLLVNKHREVYSLYLPDYRIEATEEPGTLVPLSKNLTGAEYLLLDIASLESETAKNLNRQYDRLAQFGDSSKGPEIDLYRKR